MEAFKKDEFEAEIGPVNFVQDNESKSSFGVLTWIALSKRVNIARLNWSVSSKGKF